MIDVRVLGPVSASDGTDEFGVGGPTAATVLGVLAANAPATVASSRLVEAVWEEDPPRSARKTLQAHVSKLRRALAGARDAPGVGDAVVRAGDGYRLDPDAAATDVARFRSLSASAGDAGQWRTALDQWRGEPLQGCIESHVVQAERTRLRAEYLSAVESWAGASLGEGRPEPVVAELERLLVDHPLHEHLWALLVEAQAATGRRRDALASYQRVREQLVEAGLEPGARLRAAEQTALAGVEPQSAAHTRGERTGVPAPRASMLGRAEEVRRLRRAVGGQRLVTVTGPGGCGKTTVASEVARTSSDELAGGAVFVDLVPATDTTGVARAFAAAWGIRQLADEGDVAAAVAARVAERPTLVVVDNCEHVVEAAAEIVDRLLDAAEPLRVLATSRQPLEVSGEQLWPLHALPIEDAADLFQERIGSEPGPPDRAAVEELCRMLDGLPLAIELAAARARQFSVAEMVTALAERPGLLRRHRRTEDRHDSLTATIRWSYDLLEPVEQACLRRLAVFRGSFDAERSAAVIAGVADADDAFGVVGDLAAKSLLVADPTGGRTTFRMLDTIRSFAWAEALAVGDAEEAARRHRDWYLAWAERVPPGSTCLRLAAAYGLAPHHEDLLAAMRTSQRRQEHEALARLAVLASGLLFCPGGQGDAEAWISRALEHRDELSESSLADALGVGSLTALMASEPALGVERILAGATPAARHRSGAGPLLFALVHLAPGGDRATNEVREQAEAMIGDPSGLQDDIHVALLGMHTFWTFVSAGPEAALAEADAMWEQRRWSDDRTMATWGIHAALLHMTGQHERLARRLAEMERAPADGPSSPFLTLFEALSLAGTGAAEEALARLREVRREHWVRMPGIENDFLAAVAAIADLRGDRDQARRLLSTPDLWPRHPSTGLVQLHHRRRLGLPPPPTLGSTDHTAVSALLDEQLGR